MGRVAPITGAWIETYTLAELAENLDVAPITGAWIETYRPYEGQSD